MTYAQNTKLDYRSSWFADWGSSILCHKILCYAQQKVSIHIISLYRSRRYVIQMEHTAQHSSGYEMSLQDLYSTAKYNVHKVMHYCRFTQNQPRNITECEYSETIHVCKTKIVLCFVSKMVDNEADTCSLIHINLSSSFRAINRNLFCNWIIKKMEC